MLGSGSHSSKIASDGRATGLNLGLVTRLESFGEGEPAWETAGDVEAIVVPGGLFDANEQRAVNHDETQRAAWVTWENGGGRLTIPLASAEEPLDLSEEAS